jgi:cytochrome bd-type quinol oxidase subunit 2
MIQKIKSKLLILGSLLILALPVAVPAMASAQCSPGVSGSSDCIQGGLCQGAQSLTVTAGTQQCSEQGTGINGLVKTIINVLSIIVGLVAVIMIIIGGFRYITSAGNPEQAKTARNTILYAIIGLVIVALAQIIVRFVLTKTTNPTS